MYTHMMYLGVCDFFIRGFRFWVLVFQKRKTKNGNLERKSVFAIEFGYGENSNCWISLN